MIWTLVAVVVLPLTVGYLFGKNQVAPNTEAGREYYYGFEEYDYT